MKKLLFVVALVSFLAADTASAQVGMMGSRGSNTVSVTNQTMDIGTALQEIYASQAISDATKLNCSRITDVQFEKLGDAYMGYIHPGQEHAIVEQMMGGEGSATLIQAHINMGRAYTGCWSGYNAAPFLMPMMGYRGGANIAATPYSFNGGYRPSMMNGYGNYASGWMGFSLMVLIWTLTLLSIAACIKYLRRK